MSRKGILAGGICVLLSLGQARASVFFSEIGFLPNANATEAFDVSSDGSTVVGQSGGRAFRWTRQSGIVALRHLGIASGAQAVSGDGRVAAGSYLGRLGLNLSEAVRWATPTSSAQGLGVASPSGNQTYALGIDDQGGVVVGRATTNFGSIQPFVWTAATGVQILGQNDGEARSVSRDGTTVVGIEGGFAFRWTLAGGLQSLGAPASAAATVAYDCSADGSVIVGTLLSSGGSVVSGFRWTESDGFQGIGGVFTPRAVNSDGSIVVGRGFGAAPVIWGNGSLAQELTDSLNYVMQNQMAGWTVYEVSSISADGTTIVGSAQRPDGRETSWVISIPSPTSGSLLLALGLLGARRSRSLQARPR